MSAAVRRIARCAHGMAPGICTERNCEHYDGGSGGGERFRSKRLRLTGRCRRCGREVPAELFDAQKRRCIGGCADTLSDQRDVVPV